jgi:hypothetical protein
VKHQETSGCIGAASSRIPHVHISGASGAAVGWQRIQEWGKGYTGKHVTKGPSIGRGGLA